MSVAGCMKTTPEQPVSSDNPLPISFQTPIVSAITKSVSNADYPQSSSFGVFGVCHSGDFGRWNDAKLLIDGAKFGYVGTIDDATAGSGAWCSDPVYYWPKSGKMTFAAWSPYLVKDQYGTNFSYGSNGLSVNDFTTSPDNSIDLMYSERAYNKTSSDGENTKYDGIDLIFHHTLAALTFKAVSAAPKVKIAVTKIAISGICKKGNFCENVDETVPSSYKSSPAWSNLSEMYTEADPLVVTSDELFIIPQDIAADAKMRVYYTIQVGDASPIPCVSSWTSLSGRTYDSGAALDKWEMAHRYVYNLRISGMVQIRFSVDVDSWGSV